MLVQSGDGSPLSDDQLPPLPPPSLLPSVGVAEAPLDQSPSVLPSVGVAVSAGNVSVGEGAGVLLGDVVGVGDACTQAAGDVVGCPLTVALAGHVPPVIAHPDRPPEVVAVRPGPPLGSGWSDDYTSVAFPMTPGTTVVLYTDGLVETRSRSLSVRP